MNDLLSTFSAYAVMNNNLNGMLELGMGNTEKGFSYIYQHWRLVMAVVVLFVWLLIIGFAFWQYQFSRISSLEDYWVSFSGESFADTKLVPKNGEALIVHIVDPNCPCSRFTKSHIEELELKYANNAEFINITNIPADDSRRETLMGLMIPASPAVAIWDGSGHLAYFGPYSGGRFCGSGLDFVSMTLSSLKAMLNLRWINQEAVGCFCPWSISNSGYEYAK
jgi:hypothetical protein